MLFRIPPELKETVDIVRESAYDGASRETVAEDVKCMIQQGLNLVHLEGPVPITYSRQSAQRSEDVVLLEKPNEKIVEGDVVVVRESRNKNLPIGSELKVYGIRSLGEVMVLDINERSIP